MKQSVKQTVFVGALIHNAEQQVLVLRRSLKDHFLPGYLELPGGRVEAGESLEHALRRKLAHDLGVTLGKEPYLYYTSVARIDTRGPYIRIIFEVPYQESMGLRLSHHHNEYLWLDTYRLPKENMTVDAQRVLIQYLGVHKSEDNDAKKTTLIIHTDGGSRGNPGPSAAAFVCRDGRGSVVEAGGKYLGVTTNNVAEYQAVLLALQALAAQSHQYQVLDFNLDSMLVVNQLNGEYKVKNKELVPINREIRELLKQFKTVHFNHIPREENGLADAAVNRILDEHQSGSDILEGSDH